MSRLCPLLYRSSPASHNEEAVSCSTSAMLRGDFAILLHCCNYISAGHTAPEENGVVVFEFASGRSAMQYLSCNTCRASGLCHNSMVMVPVSSAMSELGWSESSTVSERESNLDSPKVRQVANVNASTFHRPVINCLVNNELVRNCAQV